MSKSSPNFAVLQGCTGACSLSAVAGLQLDSSETAAQYNQCHFSCLGRQKGISREAAQRGLDTKTAEVDVACVNLISIRMKAVGGQRDSCLGPGLT